MQLYSCSKLCVNLFCSIVHFGKCRERQWSWVVSKLLGPTVLGGCITNSTTGVIIKNGTHSSTPTNRSPSGVAFRITRSAGLFKSCPAVTKLYERRLLCPMPGPTGELLNSHLRLGFIFLHVVQWKTCRRKDDIWLVSHARKCNEFVQQYVF